MTLDRYFKVKTKFMEKAIFSSPHHSSKVMQIILSIIQSILGKVLYLHQLTDWQVSVIWVQLPQDSSCWDENNYHHWTYYNWKSLLKRKSINLFYHVRLGISFPSLINRFLASRSITVSAFCSVGYCSENLDHRRCFELHHCHNQPRRFIATH